MTERQKTALGTTWFAFRLIVFAYCVSNCAFQVKARFVVSESEVLQRLFDFEYLPLANLEIEDIFSTDLISTAISEFQSYMGIDVTGVINLETAQLMNLPRCGVENINKPKTGRRSKRYVLQGTRWSCEDLTYKISSYPEGLDRTNVDKEIARAFALWSNYTDLSFTPMSGEVDIDIRFEVGDHGDGDPFDGRTPSNRNILAHARFPDDGGDVHFDKAERWTINSNLGYNLFYVAAHEIGHSLGLAHSDIGTALMASKYKRYDPNFTLHSDDIAAIQKIYGSKTSHESPDICADPKVDTMFDSIEGDVYAFKGKYYWTLTTYEIAAKYPKLIAETWTGLPGDIDAAFTYNGRTYFFKGSEYWTYLGVKMNGVNPRKISEGFPGIPDDVDAATVWTGDGKIYFYKGSKFWRFNPAQRPLLKKTFPQSIQKFKGVPDHVDAAVAYNGYTYFIKGDNYYRFNHRKLSVDLFGFWYDCNALTAWPEIEDWWSAASFNADAGTYAHYWPDYEPRI